MAFEFGKRRRSRRSKRSKHSGEEEVKVSRRRSRRGSRRSRRGSRRSRRGKRSSRRGGSSGAKKLFTQRVKAVQALMKKGMSRKAAWKKVMAGRAFGVQVIPGF
jgi:hypothetical protein